MSGTWEPVRHMPLKYKDVIPDDSSNQQSGHVAFTSIIHFSSSAHLLMHHHKHQLAQGPVHSQDTPTHPPSSLEGLFQFFVALTCHGHVWNGPKYSLYQLRSDSIDMAVACLMISGIQERHKMLLRNVLPADNWRLDTHRLSAPILVIVLLVFNLWHCSRMYLYDGCGYVGEFKPPQMLQILSTRLRRA